jgi:membrane protease YdiL (CAAX protease family)
VGSVRRLLEVWQRIDREAAEERARSPGIDTRAPLALVLAALVLILEEYYGDRPTFAAWLAPRVPERWSLLGGFAWWAAAKVLGYLLVPLAAIRIAGGRARDYGLGLGDTRRHLRIAGALFAAILPLLVGASFTSEFRAAYPLYRDQAQRVGDLVAWEAMYASSFVALEFFFRGFLVFALRRAMGMHAIFVAMVPYCMIHFQKPPAEAVGAIVAGIALGTLALATGSIWCGVLVHVAAAWTMDALALWQAS